MDYDTIVMLVSLIFVSFVFGAAFASPEKAS
jgi:hypothetical protein